MEKYRNKYRIQSHRKPNWDYSSEAMYFITFITQNRICNLGNVVNGEMVLSEFGKIVELEWFKSFEIRLELFLDEFVIMPNHLHAIVIINNPNDVVANVVANANVVVVETHGRASLRSSPSSASPSSASSNEKPIMPTRLPKSISSFIAGFKSGVNSKIDDFIDENALNMPKFNRNNHFFQPNYHDHIIRNDAEYHRIKNYIINNPVNWNKDKFYE